MIDEELNIYTVIKKYQEFVKRAIAFLQNAYSCEDIIHCLMTGVIPRKGEVKGITFSFHGIGCGVIIDGYTVEWDYGPNGRIDGFEAWKLWEFTRDHQEEFGEFSKLERLRTEVDQLRKNDEVYSMRDFGLTGNIVFLKQSISPAQ